VATDKPFADDANSKHIADEPPTSPGELEGQPQK